ncbi:hypothetical protein BD410DRAFT_2663 [Rickenella mellea]|uniref:Uncharacterized protein n=1 Tax=Rickenella mellea TaxID=50990 RepID=A0A4R5XEA9_9AGAM|nr:hypothetical protein BD410DRAFT_2663 [Rickenella mellea]
MRTYSPQSCSAPRYPQALYPRYIHEFQHGPHKTNHHLRLLPELRCQNLFQTRWTIRFRSSTWKVSARIENDQSIEVVRKDDVLPPLSIGIRLCKRFPPSLYSSLWDTNCSELISNRSHTRGANETIHASGDVVVTTTELRNGLYGTQNHACNGRHYNHLRQTTPSNASSCMHTYSSYPCVPWFTKDRHLGSHSSSEGKPIDGPTTWECGCESRQIVKGRSDSLTVVIPRVSINRLHPISSNGEIFLFN